MSDENNRPDLSLDDYLRSTGRGDDPVMKLLWSIDPLMSAEKFATVGKLFNAYNRMLEAHNDFRQIYIEAFRRWTDEQLAMGREPATLIVREFEDDTHLLNLVRAGLPQNNEGSVMMPCHSSLLNELLYGRGE